MDQEVAGVFEIQSLHSGKLLTVEAGGMVAGTAVQQSDADRSIRTSRATDMWKVRPVMPGTGAVDVASVHARRLLNLLDGCLEEGAAVCIMYLASFPRILVPEILAQ